MSTIKTTGKREINKLTNDLKKTKSAKFQIVGENNPSK